MKRGLLLSSILILLVAQVSFGHDPRTAAKDFSHSMSIEGIGKLTVSYKSLHFNEPAFNNRKAERALTTFNRLWKTIGKFESDFDVVIAGVQIPKGSYGFGVNFDANDNFKLVFSSGGKEITVPLTTAMDNPKVNYLSFDLRPENDSDAFTIEGRYGMMRVSAEVKVPHDHDKKK